MFLSSTVSSGLVPAGTHELGVFSTFFFSRDHRHIIMTKANAITRAGGATAMGGSALGHCSDGSHCTL